MCSRSSRVPRKPSRHRPAAGAVLWLALVATPPPAAANDESDARRWLAESDRTAASLEPGGVYASYAQTRLRLAQARAHARLGDVEATRARLPYGDRQDPEWASGGDGMVRMLILSLDLEEIHGALLAALVSAGRTEDAFGYARGLSARQNPEGAFLQLGAALGRAGQSEAGGRDELAEPDRALVDAGVARSLLEEDRAEAAGRVITGIQPEALRTRTVALLAGRLVAEQALAATARLLQLGVLPEPESAMLAHAAVSAALLAGDLATADELTKLVQDAAARDRLEAMLAHALAEDGQRTRAERLFDAAAPRQASTWEQVAIVLGRDDWLEARYLAIESPWRRTERLYHYARRKLDEGDAGTATRLAGLAADSARDIPPGGTRWLAYRMLAELHGAAGDPRSAASWAAEIPPDSREGARELAQANAAVVLGWARAGDVERALRTAAKIEDPARRVDGILAAARAVHAEDADAYARIAAAAEDELLAWPETRERERRAAWGRLAAIRCRVGGPAGAMTTGRRASEISDRVAALEAVLTCALESEDRAAAEAAARALPAGGDPGTREDPRSRALARVAESLAGAGQGRAAAALLEDIAQDPVRELATPTVVSALVRQGAQEQAIELATTLSRSDTREQALAAVLRALAEQRLLPDPARIMASVPQRHGGELCWASAAAGAGADGLEPWLRELDQPACRAFAYAGAAWARLSGPGSLQPGDLFARLDPARAEDRMAEAMQKSAAGRRLR